MRHKKVNNFKLIYNLLFILVGTISFNSDAFAERFCCEDDSINNKAPAELIAKELPSIYKDSGILKKIEDKYQTSIRDYNLLTQKISKGLKPIVKKQLKEEIQKVDSKRSTSFISAINNKISLVLTKNFSWVNKFYQEYIAPQDAQASEEIHYTMKELMLKLNKKHLYEEDRLSNF